ncbi:hypothetical protein [Paracoccus shandongensis]|uniref:hypothetical protein n=1 Tax=Paracoccus shandongensis TaxID=2816048 RepID=UPI001F40F4C0|nr:hypothetical protein [Paracoccus shandongensis]
MTVLIDDDRGISIGRLDGASDAADASAAAHVWEMETHETFLGSSHSRANGSFQHWKVKALDNVLMLTVV